MRTLLLTILGCLAFTAGHAGAAAQNPAPETAGAQQDAKARGAHLRMEVAGHDFGDVPRKGGDLVREFTFTNDGTAPLVVTRVITSCSCLKASFPKRPVPPGGQGVIRIRIQPQDNFRVFVCNNYDKAQGVAELAALAGMSLSVFKRRFAEHFNDSVYHWMMRQKALKIFSDIRDGEDSTKALMNKYGFRHYTQFSRFCKNYLQATPAQLIASIKEG